MNIAILIAVVVALAEGNAAGECSGYYRVPSNAGQVLKDDVDSPYQLAIDRDTNTLFFSHTTINGNDAFQSMYLNLKNGSSGVISGINSGFAHAYDSQEKIVYIGGRFGVYKFDYGSKRAVNLNITGNNIWQMFYKDGLYFTTYPEEKAYIYREGRLKRVLKNNKVMLVAVDKDKSLVFTHDGQLKRVKDRKITLLGDYSINGFNADTNNTLYFSTPNAIYKVSGSVMKKIAEFDDIFGFAMEGENQIIYASEKSILRLTLTPDMCGDDKTRDNENESFNNVQ